ncbi:MAG: circularly permuted type 2 ATP-grasp protein [Saprospiraceae bacterium]
MPGVSYMLENREILKKSFPSIFEKLGVQHISDYPIRLLEMLQYISKKDNPRVVVLTPAFTIPVALNIPTWPKQMGVYLVESSDSWYATAMCRCGGRPKRASKNDVIYCRIDDTLDPAFRPDS